MHGRIFGCVVLGCISIFINSCAAQKQEATTYCDCNKVDKNGRPEGYWKQLLPDSNGHFRIAYEGIFFRGKHVGVWNRANRDGSQVYQRQIFMDTTETSVQEINYDLDGQMTSRGMLTPLVLS